MSASEHSSKSTRGTILALVLLLAIGAVILFRTDLITSKNVRQYDSELLPSIKVTGTIKVNDLQLSGREITSLNNLSRSYGILFPSMDMNLILENKFDPIIIKPDTVMILKLTCYADKSEVAFRSRKVKRSQLVKHVQRSMKKAESEFLHYRDKAGKDSEFGRLVL